MTMFPGVKLAGVSRASSGSIASRRVERRTGRRAVGLGRRIMVLLLREGSGEDCEFASGRLVYRGRIKFARDWTRLRDPGEVKPLCIRQFFIWMGSLLTRTENQDWANHSPSSPANNVVPIRTRVAPCSTATSKSPDMPIDRFSS